MSSVRAIGITAAALMVVTLGAPAGTYGGPPAHRSQAGSSAYRGPKVVEKRLRNAVRSLDVGRERRRGYDRDKFELWTDADHDGCDTRAEVLIAESSRNVTVNEYCTVQSGRWRSYYDRARWDEGGDLDIDHVVPLAEAWDSGARRWTGGTRRRFANDLRDRRTLVAVTASVNRSKGDRDVAEWLPEYGRCRYVREWTAVKTRWRLEVNRAEKRALRRVASGCRNRLLRIRLATVDRR